MNRTERRAAERKAQKLARKAGFAAPIPTATAPAEPATTTAAPTVTQIPEPGIPFPAFAAITEPSISAGQLAANRANAQHSTGPVTQTGRATSSQNRTTHGLARHNGNFLVLLAEDQNGFEALKASLVGEHEPATETESILVASMAESHWLANRAQTLQSTCCDPITGEILDALKFSLYLRYQTTHTGAFHKSLNDLLKLRAERRKEANGFEAQTRRQEQQRIQTERHEMQKQKHYWDVLLKDAQACNQLVANTTQQRKAAAENPGFEAQYAAELAKRGLEKLVVGAAMAA